MNAKRAKAGRGISATAADDTPAPDRATVCEQYIRDNPEVISGFSLTISGQEQAALAAAQTAAE